MTYPDHFFDTLMYPLEAVSLAARRREVIPRARADVLEIGAGTGANLPHYDPGRIDSLVLTDTALSDLLEERAARWRSSARFTNGAVKLREADACSLPFSDDSFDTVIATLVLCSVSDQRVALGQIARVLRPGGRLLFIEHVRPPGPVRHLVDSLNPLWHAVTRECNINRDTAAAIVRAGLRMQMLRRGGGGFLIDGVARAEPATATPR